MTCCAGRAFRGRGAADDGLLARPERPSRCTLPITALRVTFPNSAAIWLAESPPSQSFLSCSTRSSDQVNTVIALFLSRRAGRLWDSAAMPKLQKSQLAESLSLRRAQKARRTFTPNTCDLQDQILPHEMSYPTVQRLQYGVTPAQDFGSMRPHVPSHLQHNAIFPRHRTFTGQHLARWLTVIAARIECLSRAAPKRRHVLFSGTGCRCDRANARITTYPNLQ